MIAASAPRPSACSRRATRTPAITRQPMITVFAGQVDSHAAPAPGRSAAAPPVPARVPATRGPAVLTLGHSDAGTSVKIRRMAIVVVKPYPVEVPSDA